MSFINKARRAIASAISPEAFKRGESQAKQAGITPNEFNRAVATAYAFYEGINHSRERTPIPFGIGDTKDMQSSWTRLEYLNIARYLYINDGLTRGAINDIARYTVGTGLHAQAQTDDDKVNDQYEDYFEEWANRADYSGLHHFDHLQLLWNVGEVRDGDIGIVLTDDGAGDPRVQTIRGHRIGNFGNHAEGLSDGVRTDQFDRIVSYRVKARNGTTRDIPARSFILHYEPRETDALRGITALDHAINHVRDKKDTIGFEKTAIKTLSTRAFVLKTGSGTVDPAEWADESVEAAEPTRLTKAQMEGGTIPVIGKDEDLQAFSYDRPSPAFIGFLEFLIREIACGLGVPYEFIWNPEKIGGANTRFVLKKAQRRFDERQSIFKRRVLRRIWGYVISNGVVRGKLPDNPKKFKVDWQLPAELSVDAGRDAMQDREDVKFGLMPEADHYGMRGQDWKRKRDQIEREVDDLLERADRIAKKRKITLEMALSLLKQSTPNGSPLLNAQNGQNEKKPNPSDK